MYRDVPPLMYSDERCSVYIISEKFRIEIIIIVIIIIIIFIIIMSFTSSIFFYYKIYLHLLLDHFQYHIVKLPLITRL